MAAPSKVLLYGANGYSGRMLAARLLAQGVELIVAGRREGELAAVAAAGRLECRAFDLTCGARIDQALDGALLVLNAAGPFHRTTEPLLSACLRRRVHYLDIGGELGPLLYARSRGRDAAAAGVMLLPSVGFDVVPSDCLAAHVARRLPGAQHLMFGIDASPLLSPGSARTLADSAGVPVYVRRAGLLEPLLMRLQVRWVDFGAGHRPAVAVTWGDLVTAFHSTAIPNIEVYFEATAFRWCATALNQLGGLLFRPPWVRPWLEAWAGLVAEGPTPEQRARHRSVIVAEARMGRRRVRSRLSLPEAYELTAHAAAAVVGRVLGGALRPGFQTPATLLGADFVCELSGVERSDDA